MKGKTRKSQTIKQQAGKVAALKKEKSARDTYVKKKTMEGSAFGLKDGFGKKAQAKRTAARTQARQAGGSGRIGGTTKRVTPRKLKSTPKGRNK